MRAADERVEAYFGGGEALLDAMEKLAREYPMRGTSTRTNLAPNAPRVSGYLVDRLPSERVCSGPLFDLVVASLPSEAARVENLPAAQSWQLGELSSSW